jgi:hypothetical protein
MTEIVLSIRTKHNRHSLTASIRVSLSPPKDGDMGASRSIADGLGEGPLLPESNALPYLCDAFIIDVHTDFGR